MAAVDVKGLNLELYLTYTMLCGWKVFIVTGRGLSPPTVRLWPEPNQVQAQAIENFCRTNSTP